MTTKEAIETIKEWAGFLSNLQDKQIVLVDKDNRNVQEACDMAVKALEAQLTSVTPAPKDDNRIKITIGMQKTITATRELEVTKEQYDDILENGTCPFYDEMEQALLEENEKYFKNKKVDVDIEVDYAIWDENDRTLVDWN